MRLYDIPRGSKIKVDEGIITFDHLDGMYSYCTCDWVDKEKGNNVVHLAGHTPLKKVGKYYKILTQDEEDTKRNSG